MFIFWIESLGCITYKPLLFFISIISGLFWTYEMVCLHITSHQKAATSGNK